MCMKICRFTVLRSRSALGPGEGFRACPDNDDGAARRPHRHAPRDPTWPSVRWVPAGTLDEWCTTVDQTLGLSYQGPRMRNTK